VPSRTTFFSPELLALPASNTIVLSPSDRARRAFARQWASEAQLASGRTAVALPRFETLPSYFARLWEEGQLFGEIDDERTLVSPAIESALWRHIASDVANTSRTQSAVLADRFAEAWMLEHGYRDLDSAQHTTRYASGANGELYRAARSAFVESLKRVHALTHAELAHALSRHGKYLEFQSKQHLVLTPNFYSRKVDTDLLSIINKKRINAQFGWAINEIAKNAVCNRSAVSASSDERSAAIAWAAQRIDSTHRDAAETVAIVVPDLKRLRGAWQRALIDANVPFNLSLGLAVSKYPWAAAGFTLVSSLFSSIAPETIAQALRHARWKRDEATIAAINRREISLLRAGEAEVTLFRFCDVQDEPPSHPLRALSEKLVAIKSLISRKSETRAYWRDVFERAIDAFSDSRAPLDSQTFQLRDALLKSIETWQQLDGVLPRVSIADAQQELIAMTDQSAFQPEGSDAPIQVIGLLEAAGVPFDAMWITGFSERVLPEGVRANPCLSIQWQRAQRVGLASVEECEARATKLVAGWQRLSRELIASLPERIDDEPQVWSPLTNDWPITPHRTVSRNAVSHTALETLDDEVAPRWRPESSRGVRALEAQALCPRRGFAEGRLRLQAWPNRNDGISPQLRGELVHAVAERIGHALKATPNDFDALRLAVPDYVDAAVDRVARANRAIPAHVWDAERVRATRVFSKFIEIDSARTSFSVRDVEQKVETKIADIEFSLRIDRIDSVERVDPATGEVIQGGLAVIDFKSGPVDRKGVFDERLTSPQLPLYANALDIEKIDAIAFAQINDDYQRYLGFGTASSGFEVRQRANTNIPEWVELRNSWKMRLETLANELIEGEAVLAPAYGKKTCDQCDFQRFCRIDLQALRSHDDGGDDEEDAHA
jgi:ATP-dependent helicase/nuclease subunit B